jgi:Cu/Zn superoxide dismutase
VAQFCCCCFVQLQNHPNAPTQVIGSCRGIAPGLHGMVILENGDLSLLRSSAGLHFDAPGSTASHGGANTKERHVSERSNIEFEQKQSKQVQQCAHVLSLLCD